LIVVTVLVVSAITIGAALLVEDAEFRWGLGPGLYLLTTGIILVLSGVCINFLPNVITTLWRLTTRNTDEVIDLLRGLNGILRRPLRWAGIGVTTAALVAAGVALRPPPTGLEPGELVVMTAFAADPGDARSMLIEQWNRLNPDNPAKFDYAPVNSDEQHTRMVNDAKPGAKQRADVYVLDIVWMAEFAARGYIQSLDQSALRERDLGDFVPKVLESCEYDGKLWALPLNSDVGLIYRRTGIPGLNNPQTWDDYFGAAAKNTVAAARVSDPHIEAANAAQLAPDDEMLTITALEAIWAAGGRVVGPNGQAALTSDGSEVEFGPVDLMGLQNLAAAAHDSDIVLTRDDEAQKTSADVAVRTFVDGRTGYMRNWPVARDIIGDKVSFTTTAPPTPSVLGGQNLAISASTDKPRAAQALIQFLSNPSSQQILSEVGGFVPTRQSAFNYSRRPDADQLQVALNQARLRPITPHYTEFSQVFRQGIARALNNNGKLEDDFAGALADILNGS
jgi:multiple sugar transport system substrate-binding protein